jgi:predicted GIY-YIG superfamily endonuclease
MLRDQLAARLAEMGSAPDFERLAAEVLGIHGARGELARRLVSQALLMGDRRELWRRIGRRICQDAPAAAGVYVFRDLDGRALYVGKAIDLRRRFRAHFADRQWRKLKPAMARVATAEWHEVGSELEALLREAMLIAALQPLVNVQVGEPVARHRRVPRALVRDVILLLPSVDPEASEVIAARTDDRSLLRHVQRNGTDLQGAVDRFWDFFQASRGNERHADEHALAPLVYSWLAGRGRSATRLDPHDAGDAAGLGARLGSLLSDRDLFTERIHLVSRSGGDDSQ